MLDHLAGDCAIFAAQEAFRNRAPFIAGNEVERHPDQSLIMAIDVLDVGGNGGR